MILLFKKTPKKEVLDDGSVVLHFTSNGKFDVVLEKNFIRLKSKGAQNAINRGLNGEKVFDIHNISAVQYKAPKFTTGYVQIILIGSYDARNGVFGAVKDENSILFTKKDIDLALELKDYIEKSISNRSGREENGTISDLDQIKKLKELLDMGAITQKEFNEKKQQLLNI